MRLSKEQQQIILDFYFRCGTEDDIARGRDLIASDAEAARLYDGLESTLTELDSIKYEPCPDNLAELTIAKLKLAASSCKPGQSNLERLLAAEQQKPAFTPAEQSRKSPVFPRKFYDIMAAAAAMILIAGVAFPTFASMRAHSQRVTCEANMARVGQGLSSLIRDNERLSGVKLAAGSPWWKIGDQGSQPQSNTRVAWQLIKQDYVKPETFICAGHKGGQPVTSQQLLEQLHDFPCRNNISYSFMIICDSMGSMEGKSRRIIMSDMNPVFRRIPECGNRQYDRLNEFEKVLLTDQLKKMSSPNHGTRGQNVLYCDGSVEYVKQRIVNGDDIFTVRGVETYTGTETPRDENDVFLVP